MSTRSAKTRLITAGKTLLRLLIIVGVSVNVLLLAASFVVSGIVENLEPTVVLTIMSALFWLAVWLLPKGVRALREYHLAHPVPASTELTTRHES